jgi:hypothetical protein
MIRKIKNKMTGGISDNISGTIGSIICDKTGKIRLKKIVIKKRK